MAQNYTNSGLVVYTKLSPNYGSRIRSCNPNGKISKITIHHMAGNLTVEVCGNVFSGSRQASANYGIGTDGRIGLYVEEKNRAWTSSNGNNDSMAVTMEVANDGGASTNWHVSDKALASCIDLCVDICKRNDIEELVYVIKDANASNLTRHDWFAATTCPGPYLGSKFPYIVEEVNKRLGAEGKEPVNGTVEVEPVYWYRVRKSWNDAKSQLGAYTVLANAQKKADENEGYFVFDMDGKAIYPVENEEADDIPTKPEVFPSYMVEVSIDDLNIRKGPGTNYDKNGVTGKGRFTIVAESNGQGATKWGKLKSGAGWISLDYAKKVEPATTEEPKVEENKQPTKDELEKVAKDVIQGKYGNGETRKRKLAEAGYDYQAVQTIVDQMMSGTYGKTSTAPAKKSNEEIAREVIRGWWSNGSERVKRLTAAGYDPKTIQDIVNKLYK